MTAGVAMVAKNGSGIDYLAIAAWNAANVHRHLGVPVALITDDAEYQHPAFDRIIRTTRGPSTRRHYADVGTWVDWHNGGRHRVYELSPWDRTLLIDVDYVVASSALKPLFETRVPIAAARWSTDITELNSIHAYNWFGATKTPQWWATMIYWERGTQAESVFQAMAMIEANWPHYAALYRFPVVPFRNDYALSIALSIANGHHWDTIPSLPYTIACVPDTATATATRDPDRYRIDYEYRDRPRGLYTSGVDIHIMGKRSLEKIIEDHPR